MKLAKDLAFYLGEEREDVETIPTLQVSEEPVEIPKAEGQPKPITGNRSVNTKPKVKHQTAQTLEDYVERFLIPHKLQERKATYISREAWEHLDFVARRLGVSASNVSSLLEQIVREHLTTYAEAIETWRKL